MEEVPPALRPDGGQFPGELPEPLAVPEIPAPISPEYVRPQQPEQQVDQTPEGEFDKRNEQFRRQPLNNDELATTGMVALGDVLKQRQPPQPTQPHTNPAIDPRFVPPIPPPMPPASFPQSSTSGGGTRLPYSWAITIGIIAALIAAPLAIFLITR